MSRLKVGDHVVLDTKTYNRNTIFTINQVLSNDIRVWCNIVDSGISNFGRDEKDLYWFPDQYIGMDRKE